MTNLTEQERIVNKLKSTGYSPCFFTTLKNTDDKNVKMVYNFLPIRKFEFEYRIIILLDITVDNKTN